MSATRTAEGRFTRVRWYCTRPGCRAPHYAKGLCRRHYVNARHVPRPPRPKARRLTAAERSMAATRAELDRRGRLPAFYRKSTG